MSYTPEDQKLTQPLTHAIDALKEIQEVIERRINSDDWNNTHIQNMIDLDLMLRDWRYKLIMVRKDNF